MLDLTDRASETRRLARWFVDYSHHGDVGLLQVGKGFHDQAESLIADLPDGPELWDALRKLLDAKEAAVRAVVDKIGSDRSDVDF